MLVVFATLIFVLFLVVTLYPCVPRPENVLNWFLSVLVEFSFCVFVFVTLRVSSGSPMFDFGS